MENKAKTGRKLIMMSAELFAPVLIVMIVVFILLNNNIIGVLPAFILMLIVFGIVLLLIISIIRSVVIPIRAAITGISADDKAARGKRPVLSSAVFGYAGISGEVWSLRGDAVLPR